MKYYFLAFKKYAVFSGRSTRSEYWYFTFISLLIFGLFFVCDIAMMYGSGIDFPIFSQIYNLIIVIPSLALGARRLHDIGKSGWWMLVVIIPLVGALYLIYFLMKDGQVESNIYGSNPKNDAKADVPTT